MSTAATPATPPPICFLMGILQRSGTNHLSRLLVLHPQVVGPGPIWEDYLVYESGLLREYADRLYTRWNQKWDIPGRVGPQETMLQHFGDALQAYLHRQVRPVDTLVPARTPGITPRIRLTKTPSVQGLENFTALFPSAQLIILVRDGRAVVESGVQSFGWDYDDGARQWAQAARTIIEFRRTCPDVERRMILVRYEDLVQEEETQLRRVFSFLGLDPALYDFEKAGSLNVLGSSEIRKQGEEIHWRGTEKNREFNPLARFAHWDAARHARFWKIAGPLAEKLGYEPVTP